MNFFEASTNRTSSVHNGVEGSGLQQPPDDPQDPYYLKICYGCQEPAKTNQGSILQYFSCRN